MTILGTPLASALADRYRIGREIGAGGMATVFLAHDLRHERDVAIKVLHADLAAALGGERFLSEIKTTARLQHPHILPLLDSGEAAGLLYYVMPFVEGETLRHRMERERQLPIGDALLIAREVADALGYAHAQGVIHRDIKPENILLQRGHALVADFGIALAVQTAGGARMTQTGLSLGTPQYMSPEQAMGERSIDARSDIYALGAVLYEMLAGEPPFTGPTVQAIVAKVLTDSARPVNHLRKSVPDHVADAISSALEKLPADRTGSADAFVAALSGAVPRTKAQHRGAPPTAGRAWMFAAIGMSIVAIAASARMLSMSRDRSSVALAPPARFSFLATLGGGGGNLIAISPDGSKIVYHGREAQTARFHLALRKLEEDTVVAIPGTEDSDSPCFSPDGRSIAFRKGAQLMRVDVSGGGPRAIGPPMSGRQSGCAWSRDGNIITVANDTVFVVNADGGEPRRLRQADGLTYRHFKWLPDGRRLLATRTDASGSNPSVVVISGETGEVLTTIAQGVALEFMDAGRVAYLGLDGVMTSIPVDRATLKPTGPPAPFLTKGAPRNSVLARTTSIAVSPTGTVAFSAEGFGDSEMLLVDSDGKATTLPLGKRPFRGPRFSPDGRRIAVDVEPGGDLIGDVWVYDREASTFSRLTFEGSSVFPEWTRDGKSVLYSASPASGSRDLYQVPVDRSSPPQVVAHSTVPIFEGTFAPNGGPLFYRSNSSSGGRDIFMLGSDGKSVPFAATQFQERSLTMSPDGRLVLYVSNEAGSDEVYLRRIDGTARAQISSDGASEPRWAPNGREAFYWAGDTLFAVPIVTSPNLGAGARRRVLVGQYARETYHANYDVAPDGKTFVMIRAGGGQMNGMITVLTNWFSALPTTAKP